MYILCILLQKVELYARLNQIPISTQIGYLFVLTLTTANISLEYVMAKVLLYMQIILVMKAYRMRYFSKSSILNPLGPMGLFTSQNKNCVQVLIHMWTTNQWIYTLKLFKVVN